MKIYRKTPVQEKRKFQKGIYHTPLLEFSILPERQRSDAVIEHLILTIDPGHDFVYHRHDYASDILTVLEGELTLTVDGITYFLNAGDAIVTEPPEIHTIFNHGKTAGILLETRVNVVKDDFFNCDHLRRTSISISNIQ